MSAHNTRLQAFVAEEVSKVKGIAVPVRAGFLERALVRTVSINKLHPNPNDEFSMPEIGPNEEIVSQYSKDFRIIRDDQVTARFMRSSVQNPLEVQKISPDGYMILNGHHRWAGAVRAGIPKMRIRILNLTQEKDIRKMLEHSNHEMRITLDMDEIVFSAEKDGKTEKPLPFFIRRFYPEKLRVGIPSLFSFCAASGYDIWLYSSGYKSLDYIRELLKLYHTQVTGIITGTARKAPKDTATSEAMEKLFAAKYVRTVHADNDLLLCIDSRTKDFKEYPLSGKGVWSAEVMEAMKAMKAVNQHG